MQQSNNQNSQIRIMKPLMLALLALLIGAIAGVWLDESVLHGGASPGSVGSVGIPPVNTTATTATTTITGVASIDLQQLEKAQALINEHYVDRNAIQSQPLTYGAISGMVDALGRHRA